MKKILFIAIPLLLSLNSKSASGQSAAFMLFSPDTRSLSLANAGTASTASAGSFFNNGAAVLFSDYTMELSSHYTQWLPESQDIRLMSASGYYRLNEKYAVNFGMRHLAYQPYNVTNEFGSITSAFHPVDYALGVGFSYLFTPKLATTVCIHYISSALGETSQAGAMSADVGAMYAMDKVSIGVKASNLGSKLDYGMGSYELPANLQVGVRLQSQLSASSSVETLANAGYVMPISSFIASVAAEYGNRERYFLRAGAYYGDKTRSIPPYLSVGVGLKIQGIRLDAAYLAGEKGSPVNRSASLSLGYGF